MKKNTSTKKAKPQIKPIAVQNITSKPVEPVESVEPNEPDESGEDP